MKSTLIYHSIVTIPLVLFFGYWIENNRPAVDLVIFGVVYPFMFRPLMDYYRLRALNLIGKEDLWKMWKWIGFYRFRYYSALMFGKS